jgi:hypothetical protein
MLRIVRLVWLLLLFTYHVRANNGNNLKSQDSYYKAGDSYNYHPRDSPNPNLNLADRSQLNGWPIGARGVYDGGGVTRYVRSGPGFVNDKDDDRHPIYGNDQLYQPTPPVDPPEPPKFFLPDAQLINNEEYSKPPRILDPLPAVHPVPERSTIISVNPHAACLQGGCLITIVGNYLYFNTAKEDKTRVFIGDVECVDVKNIDVPPDCGLGIGGDAGGSTSGSASGSLSMLVETETDAYSKIVSSSVVQLRKKQREKMLGGERVAEAYFGNRVISPYIPPGRERIEFQRRIASRHGHATDPTTLTPDDISINPESPYHDPFTAFHAYGGNFPIGIPTNFQYPPFKATPPELPPTTESSGVGEDPTNSAPTTPPVSNDDNQNVVKMFKQSHVLHQMQEI